MRRYEITRYEVTARHPDGRTFLMGYTPGVSRIGLLHVLQHHGKAVVDKLGIGEDDEISWHTKPRVHCLTAGWTIGFTGRTQRDAKAGQEFPFIAA